MCSNVKEKIELGHDDLGVAEARHKVFASYHHHVRPRHWRDQRMRAQHNESMHAAWEVQAPSLVAAYLEWCYRTRGDTTPTSPKDAMPAVPPTHVGSAAAVGQTFFEVTVVDIKG
ncbi:hypothetical protein K439DRAFT_1612815 [Ramaria rubella]|nr:hypothetical protein K439DRAFT_1612815 [Ramaria rubella]